eukprot:9388070-Karenia_brevis.AAC.1
MDVFTKREVAEAARRKDQSKSAGAQACESKGENASAFEEGLAHAGGEESANALEEGLAHGASGAVIENASENPGEPPAGAEG